MKFIITAALAAFILSACASQPPQHLSEVSPKHCNAMTPQGQHVYRMAVKAKAKGITKEQVMAEARAEAQGLGRRLIALKLSFIKIITDGAYSGRGAEPTLRAAEAKCLQILDEAHQ